MMRTGTVILCVWLVAPVMWAQTSSVEPRKTLDEAAKVMEAAKASTQIESGRRLLDQTVNAGRAEKLAAQGQRDAEQQPSFAEKQMTQAAENKMKLALNEVAPEGKALLAQESSAPPAPASAAPVSGKGAAPATPSKIIITCQGAGYFDSKQSMSVFTDDVVVTHPQFHITCDVLEVYMKKDSEKSGSAPKADANGKADAPQQEGSIQKAIAKGRRVVIQKLSETGEQQLGICRHATYIGASGDVELRDMPQVQRGKSLIRATAPSTYMILKQNGKLETIGPATTEIIHEQKSAIAPAPNTPAPKPPAGQ